MQHYENNPRHLDALKRRQVAICKGVEQMNKAFEVAIAVTKEWDGKAFNKRFTTALQNAIDEKLGVKVVSVYSEKEYSEKMTLRFSLYERSYQDTPNANGYSTWSYFDSEIYGSIYTDCLGTINAENIIERLQGAINVNLRKAYQYTDAVKHFKRDLAKYEKALDTFRKTYNAINPLLRNSELSSYLLTLGYGYPKMSPWEETREKALGL